jgi:hypothetical protein
MNKMSYGFDTFIIEFPSNMKHKIYDEGYCAGIIFYTLKGKFELVHNRQANWNRIFINLNDNSSSQSTHTTKDIPFHEGTWNMLPKDVVVIKYEP